MTIERVHTLQSFAAEAENEMAAPPGSAPSFEPLYNTHGWLPPRWAWQRDPDKLLLPTPLTSHGVVDQRALLRLVMDELVPEYVWPPVSLNAHHFQWPEHAYSQANFGTHQFSPAYFRNLPPLKGSLPRVIENVIHKITEEPPVPEEDVMYHFVESWRITHRLYHSAKHLQTNPRRVKKRATAVRPDGPIQPKFRDDRIAHDNFAKEYAKYEDAFSNAMDSLRAVPPEFRLVDPDMSPRDVSSKVGRLVLKQAHLYRREASRRVAA